MQVIPLPAALAAFRATFSRLAAYRTANAAGLFTNALFLVFRASLLEACFLSGTSPRIGEMSLVEATGYAAVTQAILMVSPQWGRVGIAASVQTGQIAVELLRPVDFVWMHFASQLGASVYYALFRMLPLLLFGWALGYLPPPDPGGLLSFAASLLLASVVANAVLFLVEVSSFWLETERGVRHLVLGLALLPSGLTLPLSWFPPAVQRAFLLTPFPYTMHLPAETWLGRLPPEALAKALALQLVWAVALVLACKLAFARGCRRLVIQGG